MASRPCKPDADFKRLWRFLLPDTAFPACGTAAQSAAALGDNEKVADQPADAVPEAKRENG